MDSLGHLGSSRDQRPVRRLLVFLGLPVVLVLFGLLHLQRIASAHPETSPFGGGPRDLAETRLVSISGSHDDLDPPREGEVIVRAGPDGKPWVKRAVDGTRTELTYDYDIAGRLQKAVRAVEGEDVKPPDGR